jgi:hypothetical protein
MVINSSLISYAYTALYCKSIRSSSEGGPPRPEDGVVYFVRQVKSYQDSAEQR